MAVFTHLTEDDIHSVLARYDIGALTGFTGILQGIDNTNYKIETTTGRYILTIFESRINPADLPYFLGFMAHLSKNGVVCPHPVSPLFSLHNKPSALFSFLEGRDVTRDEITPILCSELGQLLGKLHSEGQSFPQTRTNSMSFDAWESRFIKVGEQSNPYLEKLYTVKEKWPRTLPSGNVHADLFPDNVFIKDGHIHGVIDFYFSATDFLAYDLAIVMNAWCFDDTQFNTEKWQALLSGYQSIRQLTNAEKDAYQVISQGACLRFLSSRLHDFVFHDPKNLVRPKPPEEYISKLDFHTHVNLFQPD